MPTTFDFFVTSMHFEYLIKGTSTFAGVSQSTIGGTESIVSASFAFFISAAVLINRRRNNPYQDRIGLALVNPGDFFTGKMETIPRVKFETNPINEQHQTTLKNIACLLGWAHKRLGACCPRCKNRMNNFKSSTQIRR